MVWQSQLLLNLFIDNDDARFDLKIFILLCKRRQLRIHSNVLRSPEMTGIIFNQQAVS